MAKRMNANTANTMRSPTSAPQISGPALNGMNRARILNSAKNMIQLNSTQTLNTPTLSNSNIVNFVPKNIGLLKRFYVEVLVSMTTAAGTSACNLSPFGPANILSNITFTDFQNQARINTTGWHLVAVNTFRSRANSPLAAAETSDTPLGYTNIYNTLRTLNTWELL